MKLPPAPIAYDPLRFQAILRTLEQVDLETFKKGMDVELARSERLILHATDGTRFKLKVTPAGVLSATAI